MQMMLEMTAFLCASHLARYSQHYLRPTPYCDLEESAGTPTPHFFICDMELAKGCCENEMSP